jgi:hypothetical protein
VFAAVSVLESVSSLLAPLLFNQIYAATVSLFPQAVFIAMSISCLGAVVLFRFVISTTGLVKLSESPLTRNSAAPPHSSTDQAYESILTSSSVCSSPALSS